MANRWYSDKDYKFPPQLEQLDMQSNSLKGVLTDYHFAIMSKLVYLELSDNSLVTLAFSQNWVPPFQLSLIGLRSCKLGPVFPKWLETQIKFGILTFQMQERYVHYDVMKRFLCDA